MNADNFKNEIIKKRIKCKLSQNALAKKMGIGNAQVCKFESGKTKSPSFLFVMQIIDALGYEIKLVKKKV